MPGALAQVRADDLAAVPIRELVRRNPQADWSALDDVMLGCANQAGEDNRNVARMALLLAGLPELRSGRHREPAVRLRHGCSGLGGARYRMRRGGLDHCRRRGIDVARAVRAWANRNRRSSAPPEIYDTTIGWRFVNPRMREHVRNVDSMPETGENVARDYASSAKRRTRLPGAARCAPRVPSKDGFFD